MIAGQVSPARDALIRIRVRGPAGREEVVEAVVDTGFNRFLTLPPALVSRLRLPFESTSRARLGDGRVVRMDCFRGEVQWHGQYRSVLVTLRARQGIGRDVPPPRLRAPDPGRGRRRRHHPRVAVRCRKGRASSIPDRALTPGPATTLRLSVVNCYPSPCSRPVLSPTWSAGTFIRSSSDRKRLVMGVSSG